MARFEPKKSPKERKRSLLEYKTRIKSDIKYIRKAKNVYLSDEHRQEMEDHNNTIGDKKKEYYENEDLQKMVKPSFFNNFEPYKDERDFILKELRGDLRTVKNLLKMPETKRNYPTKERFNPIVFEPFGASA